MDDQLKQSALDFHEFPVPGKIQVSPTKPLATQRDLARARYEVLLNSLRLRQAAGTLNPADIDAVSALLGTSR